MNEKEYELKFDGFKRGTLYGIFMIAYVFFILVTSEYIIKSYYVLEPFGEFLSIMTLYMIINAIAWKMDIPVMVGVKLFGEDFDE